MPTYCFYYDESDHSREITSGTIKAENYSDGFVASIVGWRSEDQLLIFERYRRFELDFKNRWNKSGELKSTTIKPERLSNGFASLGRGDTPLISRLLDIADDDRCCSYFFCASKIEYVVWQLFACFERNPAFLSKTLCYSIAKAIDMYRPDRVIELAFPKGGQIDAIELINALKSFLLQRIEADKMNVKLKEREIAAFQQALFLLGEISSPVQLSWDYRAPFEQFQKRLEELSIRKYRLYIDREKETADAAWGCGMKNVSEQDSLECVGVRFADMLSGIIAKLMKALHAARRYNTEGEMTEKKMLNRAWFQLSQENFELYKKLYSVVIERNNTFSKFCSGGYADDAIVLAALLGYINGFDSAEELGEKLESHPERFNSFACSRLEQHYVDSFC